MDIRVRRHCSPEPLARLLSSSPGLYRRFSTAGDLAIYRPDKVLVEKVGPLRISTEYTTTTSEPAYTWTKWLTKTIPFSEEEIRKEAELKVKGHSNGPIRESYSPVIYRTRASSTPPGGDVIYYRPLSSIPTSSYYPYYSSYYPYYYTSSYPYRYTTPDYYSKYSTTPTSLYDRFYANNPYYRSSVPYYRGSAYYSTLPDYYSTRYPYRSSYLLPSERYYSYYTDPLPYSYSRYYPSSYSTYYTVR